MKEYHKIQTVYKRDPQTNHKTLLEGEFSIPEFEYLQDNDWEFTEKVDGTNIRIMFNKPDVAESNRISFGGKTERAQIPESLLTALSNKFLPLTNLFKEKFNDAPVCFYGEGYGPKINKGGKYREDHGFVLFDIRIGEWWLKRMDIEGIGSMFGLDIVPVLCYGSLDDMIYMARNGFKSMWGDFEAEGIIAKPSVDLRTRSGGRIITKIKCNDFKGQ